MCGRYALKTKPQVLAALYVVTSSLASLDEQFRDLAMVSRDFH